MKQDGSSSGQTLLCFDGSPNAARAIAEAGALLGGGPALVVHVWEPLGAVLQRSHGMGAVGHLVEQAHDLDGAAADTAHRLTVQGAELAREAGFDPEPLVVKSENGLWGGIVEVAEDRDVRAIVLGSRGLSTVGPPRLGGVARAVVEHCKRPTLVIPSRSEARTRS